MIHLLSVCFRNRSFLRLFTRPCLLVLRSHAGAHAPLCCPTLTSLSAGAGGLKRKYWAGLFKTICVKALHCVRSCARRWGHRRPNGKGSWPYVSPAEGGSHPSECRVRVSTLSCGSGELGKDMQGRRHSGMFLMEDWEFPVTSRESENMGAQVE